MDPLKSSSTVRRSLDVSDNQKDSPKQLKVNKCPSNVTSFLYQVELWKENVTHLIGSDKLREKYGWTLQPNVSLRWTM